MEEKVVSRSSMEDLYESVGEREGEGKELLGPVDGKEEKGELGPTWGTKKFQELCNKLWQP